MLRRIINGFAPKSDRLLLLLILLVAAFMRFWNFEQLPFMHDEFSALFRTEYQNFHDLIRLGVVENDSHPAGVQLFLYFWVKIVGFQAFWIKLPFALMGLASVWLLYRIALNWFGSSAALLSASLMATVQYFIMYSQLARPYAAGLFFLLIFIQYWNRFIRNDRAISLWTIVLFAISAALTAMMHAFSLAEAALVYATGLFLVTNERRKQYLIAGLLALVLYLPNVPVFYQQLSAGGIGGWLGVPKQDFVFRFLFFCFNYSWPFLVIAFLVVVAPFFMNEKFPQERIRMQLVGFIWFLVPLMVAWGYSVFRTPILQFSTLYFSVPFLFMVLFSFYDTRFLSQQKSTLAIILLAGGILTTVFTRQYYHQMYFQGFDQMAVAMQNDQQTFGDSITLASYSATPRMAAFYQDNQVKSVMRFSKHDPLIRMYGFFEKIEEPYLGFGWTDYAPVACEAAAAAFFPYAIHQQAWFNSSYLTMSREPMSNTVRLTTELPVFKNSSEIDSADVRGLLFDSGVLYGKAWLISPDSLAENTDLFAVGVNLLSDKPLKNVRLVVEISDIKSDSLLHWQAALVDSVVDRTANKTSLIAGLRFSNLGLQPTQCRIKSYIWNKGHESFVLTRAFRFQRAQNPRVLGLFEPL